VIKFQAQRGIQALRNAGGGPIDLNLVPYDLLTDREKKKNRERCQELLKYIQYQGYNLHKTKGDADRDRAAKNPDNRFANNFLDRLIMYLDSSAPAMKILRPSNNFTRRNGFKKSSRYFFTSFNNKEKVDKHMGVQKYVFRLLEYFHVFAPSSPPLKKKFPPWKKSLRTPRQII
jgi:hypothetical protein